jgi:hypothetical protein
MLAMIWIFQHGRDVGHHGVHVHSAPLQPQPAVIDWPEPLHVDVFRMSSQTVERYMVAGQQRE